MFTVSELYDRAIHLSDEEAKIKLGKKVNVQSEVQRPNMYMFVRCPGTEELTSYSETRLDDIKEIKDPLSNSFFTDEVRWFKGDAPSCQFESGHQKGGNYFCWLCGIKFVNVPDYIHATHRDYKTLKDCQDTVMCTVGSRKRSFNGSTKVYENLSKDQLHEELSQRNIDYNCNNKKDLEMLLIKEMEGIQRVPSLISFMSWY